MKKFLLILPIIMPMMGAYGATHIELDCEDMTLYLEFNGYNELNIDGKKINFMDNVKITDDNGESEDMYLAKWAADKDYPERMNATYLGGLKTLIVYDVTGNTRLYDYKVVKSIKDEERYCVVK